MPGQIVVPNTVLGEAFSNLIAIECELRLDAGKLRYNCSGKERLNTKAALAKLKKKYPATDIGGTLKYFTGRGWTEDSDVMFGIVGVAE